MNIRKRTGEVVPFQEEKILNAMKKAFSGQGQPAMSMSRGKQEIYHCRSWIKMHLHDER